MSHRTRTPRRACGSRSGAAWLAAALGALFAAGGFAQQAARPAYTERGADTCIRCHDEDNRYPIFPIFQTPHAVAADPASPFAQRQCESCHGPGAEHVKRVRRDEIGAIVAFDRGSDTPVRERNAVCLQCHDDHARAAWFGGAHEGAGVSCADCHRVHAARDPVLGGSGQASLCFDCHRRQRAEFHRGYGHPLRDGLLECTSCHDPHGTLTPASLRRTGLNETCFDCHAEKRGPFLWEHAPVTEDCSLCHLPHGSNHPALLRKRLPLLCKQCHSQTFHPASSFSGSALAGGADTFSQPFVLVKGCLNCHSAVHGSNHPSGTTFKR